MSLLAFCPVFRADPAPVSFPFVVSELPLCGAGLRWLWMRVIAPGHFGSRWSGEVNFDSDGTRFYLCRYGLGKCYQSLSKQRQSEYHFRRASDIHPSNAVLLGCLGGVSRSIRFFCLFCRVCSAVPILCRFFRHIRDRGPPQ